MSCPEKEKSYLYGSGEMTRKEKTDFRRHLRNCPACAGAVRLLIRAEREEHRTLEKPSAEIRRTILRAASKKIAPGISRARIPFAWKGLAWGIPACAALAVALLLIHPPKRQVPGIETPMEWQDDFIVSTAAMDTEIEMLQSRPLASLDLEWTENSDMVPTLSEGLDRIRKQIEDLIETLYGY